ncbi:MAG: hypothetical protein BWX77_01112 [Bacteroidetes bacterium ADurb.Bin090]|nr:MAG: hypothetical protein BWX77_01112 [Bacteroidetes bacterium ADurb.Bin090]
MILSLWSCLSFSQRAWDFTNWSGDTWNDLAEDTLNWTPYFLIEEDLPPLFKGHYNANGLIFDQTKANGNDIVELQDLSFDYLYSDVISEHVFIDLAYAPSRLRLNGSGVVLNIHNCNQYDTLTVVMEYLDWKNSGDAVAVNLIPFTYGEYKETSVESYLVETTGTAGLYLRSEGALNIFSIHSGMPTEADYELLNFINEMKNDDTTWYEPGDTTWYKPGDTTWYEPGDTTWYEPGDTPWYEPGDTTWYEPGDTTWSQPENTHKKIWNFRIWSQTTLDQLAADAAEQGNWAVASEIRYENIVNFEAGPLMANGHEITETKGLIFGPMSSSKIRIDHRYEPPRLMLNGSNLSINVLNCEAGDTLIVTTITGNSTTERGITANNAKRISGAEVSLDTVTNIFAVETDGSVELTTNGGGILFYDISIVNGNSWYEPGDTTWHEPGDTTWYEPGDTTWYEPGDTTWYEPGDPENAWDTAQIKLWYPDRQVNNTEVFSVLLHTSMLDPTLGIIAYQFDLYYDNNAMEYQGYDIENSISAGGSILVNANDTGVLHVSWMKQDTLSGMGLLVKLDFKAVNYGYTYCSISDFFFNTYSIYDIENGDIEIMELIYGDVDGNYMVQAYDAAIVLQHSVGLDPLPAVDPLPWENWRLLRADVDEVEGITANDAAFILQYSAKLINTFPVESLMRSAQNNGASISITQEDNQLVFRSYGDMIGLNIQAFGDLSVLGVPEIMDKNMISATNINGELYSVGLARAYASEDGETFMIIPLMSDDYAEISFETIVNTETQTYYNQVGTGLAVKAETEKITCVNNGRQLFLYNLPTKAQISIYGITGQLMSTKTTRSANETLDIQALNKGIYLIRIENQGQTQTFKFIRN